MRKPFLIFLLSLISCLTYAQVEKVLCIQMKDGSKVSFFLKEKPRVTFATDSVEVISATTQAKIKRSDVQSFKFKAEQESGIKDITDATYSIDGVTVIINGVEPGSNVSILTIDGRTAMSETAAEGTAVFSIGTLPAGIYLLNYNDTTIKFVKP